MTVNCPLDCEYLQEARRHDRPPALNPADVPNQDVRITEKFVEEHESLLTVLANVVCGAALDTPGAVDYDAREALEALIRTYRTLDSGVYYESVPTNPLAANIFRAVQNAVAEIRNHEQKELGMSRTRDADIYGLLVFLQRIEFDTNNGRKRGRAFVDSLRAFYSEPPAPDVASSSSLLLP